MTKKNLLQMFSFMLCIISFIGFPISTKADEKNINEEEVYYDTEQARFVYDMDDYLTQLNNGTILPFNPTQKTYESDIALYELHEPSQKCSNIFGHKWDSWGSWKEVSRVHSPQTTCFANIERYRFCTRTHCSAYQIETDIVWLSTCSH